MDLIRTWVTKGAMRRRLVGAVFSPEQLREQRNHGNFRKNQDIRGQSRDHPYIPSEQFSSIVFPVAFI